MRNLVGNFVTLIFSYVAGGLLQIFGAFKESAIMIFSGGSRVQSQINNFIQQMPKLVVVVENTGRLSVFVAKSVDVDGVTKFSVFVAVAGYSS